MEPDYPTSYNGLIDRLYNKESNENGNGKFTPAVDIFEEEKQFEIQVAVPGIKKEHCNIELNEGKLTISGDRKLEDQIVGKNIHPLETQFGSFSRSFFLPENILQDNIEAVYKDGILKVKIPKKEIKVLKSIIQVK